MYSYIFGCAFCTAHAQGELSRANQVLGKSSLLRGNETFRELGTSRSATARRS